MVSMKRKTNRAKALRRVWDNERTGFYRTAYKGSM